MLNNASANSLLRICKCIYFSKTWI